VQPQPHTQSQHTAVSIVSASLCASHAAYLCRPAVQATTWAPSKPASASSAANASCVIPALPWLTPSPSPYTQTHLGHALADDDCPHVFQLILAQIQFPQVLLVSHSCCHSPGTCIATRYVRDTDLVLVVSGTIASAALSLSTNPIPPKLLHMPFCKRYGSSTYPFAGRYGSSRRTHTRVHRLCALACLSNTCTNISKTCALCICYVIFPHCTIGLEHTAKVERLLTLAVHNSTCAVLHSLMRCKCNSRSPIPNSNTNLMSISIPQWLK